MTTVETAFNKAWDEEVEKRKQQSPSFSVEDYTATGRASAKYGGKRNELWWRENGPQMVQDYIDWREAHPDWSIPEIGGQPAIELELRFTLPGMDMQVLAFIDRVFATPTGEFGVFDLKGLATDTPIATPTGWSTMAALEVGDEVFGSDGRPCRVTAKSETKFIDCYRVTFDDGRSIVCDAEHLWETTSGHHGKETSVKNIGLIKRTLKAGARQQSNHRVKMPLPLTLPGADLPIDPYVLGAWLGDGHHNRGVITKPDQELFDEIERRGYAIGIPQIDKRTGVQTRTVLGLQTALKAAGYLGDKHVPGAYLRGSVSQRLDLLRGLMDTDGSYNKPRKTVVFTSTDKAMAFAVEELALSLGERARTFEIERTGFGKTVTAYDVTWRPQVFNPFILPRKADQVDMSRGSVRSQQRVIQSVEPMPTVATVCIAVDSPDSMYLAGEGMIPTHNTGRTPETPEQLGLYRVGLGLCFDIWPTWGWFWSPGGKGHGQPLDLTMYTPEYFSALFQQAIAGINAGAFLPQPANNCKAWCGVSRHCAAVNGPEAKGYDPLAG